MIDANHVWIPATNSIGEWMTIDAGAIVQVTGIKVQGARLTSARNVGTLRVSASDDNVTWTPVDNDHKFATGLTGANYL